MRRSMLVISLVAAGCPDSDGFGDTFSASVGEVSTAATALPTSGVSDGDGSGEDTGDSTGSGDSADASTGGSSTSAASTGGSEASTDEVGSSGGMLDACQHAWEFARCPDGWEVAKADPAAPSAPSWECGDPAGTPSQGGAHTGVWATNLAGNYAEDESSALVSPSFSLSDCPGATVYLTFAHLYEFGSGDGGTVQISTDGGGSWTTVEPSWHGYCGGTLGVPWSPPGGEPGYCGGDDETWLHSLASLDEFAGEPDLRLRFVMGSDGIIEQLGWYIDSVAIEAY